MCLDVGVRYSAGNDFSLYVRWNDSRLEHSSIFVVKTSSFDSGRRKTVIQGGSNERDHSSQRPRKEVAMHTVICVKEDNN